MKSPRGEATDPAERVKKLLGMESIQERVAQLYAWCVDESVDKKTFTDLVMISLNTAELQEVVRDLGSLVHKYAKPAPDPKLMVEAHRAICERLPGLARKLQGALNG